MLLHLKTVCNSQWQLGWLEVFLSCDLRLVDLILCVIWGRFWRPYYADHCSAPLGESHGRILILSPAKGDTLLCLLSTVLCLQSTLVFWESNTEECHYCQSVLREHQLHILSKNLFSDHYLATCLPQARHLCCFIISILVTLSWWSAQSFEVV